MRHFVTGAIAAALLTATPALAAQPPAPAATGTKAVVGWAILGWNDAAGVGVSLQLPLAPQGLIHDPGFRIRESLDLDLGFDYLSYWSHKYAYPGGPYYDVSEFNLHAGLVWNFWLTPQLALYPKVALGYGVVHYDYSPAWNPAWDHGAYGGLYPELAAGLQLKLASSLTLRGELGWAGLKVGLGFAF
jgi:hypothetical protein